MKMYRFKTREEIEAGSDSFPVCFRSFLNLEYILGEDIPKKDYDKISEGDGVDFTYLECFGHYKKYMAKAARDIGENEEDIDYWWCLYPEYVLEYEIEVLTEYKKIKVGDTILFNKMGRKVTAIAIINDVPTVIAGVYGDEVKIKYSNVKIIPNEILTTIN